MKQIKRAAGLVLALVMALALTVPAWAAGSPAEHCTVYFGSGYEVMAANANGLAQPYSEEVAGYQLLTLSTSQNADGTWNYAYSVNPTYQEILFDVSHTDSGKDLLKYLDDMEDDSDDIRNFADAVYRKIQADASISPDATGTLTNGSGTINVGQGYWLFADVTDYTGKPDAVRSLVILDTKGQESLTIEQKKDAPKVDKEIVGDGGAAAPSSAAIGDTIKYKITGTVSSQIGSYVTYYYKFTDTLSKGLTYKENSLTVTIGATDVTAHFTRNIGTYDATNGTTITVEIVDLKKLTELAGVTINKDTKVVVEYSATLNEHAVTGTDVGNPNDVALTFSNDPYGNGTGTTPPDEVKTYTFDLNVLKFADNGGNKTGLAGAVFTLSENAGGTDPIKLIVEKDKEEYRVAKPEEQTTPAAVTDIETGSSGEIMVRGLAAGKYYLTEKTAPKGYNPLEGAVEVTIGETGTITVNGASATVDTAANVVKVENKAGALLPTTGGVGTTIFYIAGSVLAVGAAVLLITKKRMHDLSDQER